MSDEKRVLTTHNGVGYVYECSCGTIHVGVGPMDLRITRERLLEIYQMLGEAIARLEPCSSEKSHPTIGGSKIYSN